MKKFYLLFLLILLMFVLTGLTQYQPVDLVKTNVPHSKIINAGKLLHDIETLSADEMEGRLVGTSGNQKAREYVWKRFEEAGIEMLDWTYLYPFEFKNQKEEAFHGVNVVGLIKGKKHPEKYIVLSAHYDHLGVRREQIYNGADDNASGTAALFAIGEYFKKHRPDHSIIFAAFDAEETGLRGARAFVAAPPVKKEAILMNVNMDMVSRNDKNELYAAGAHHFPKLKEPLERVAKKAKIKLLLGHDRPELGSEDWTGQSDHAAFHQAKIPFIYFGVEDHKDYHKSTDDFANIQPEFYVRAVETIIEALKAFDKMKF